MAIALLNRPSVPAHELPTGRRPRPNFDIRDAWRPGDEFYDCPGCGAECIARPLIRAGSYSLIDADGHRHVPVCSGFQLVERTHRIPSRDGKMHFGLVVTYRRRRDGVA